MTNDYIRIQDVVDEINANADDLEQNGCIPFAQGARAMAIVVEQIPSADVVPTEPQEIGYGQCANAMLKMWIDNVVTDGGYNRIMDRLNKLYCSHGERNE